MFCNKCNQQLPDDSEFCQYCGAKLEIGTAGEQSLAEDAGSAINIGTVESTEQVNETENENMTTEIGEQGASVLTVVDIGETETVNQQKEEISDEKVTEIQYEKSNEILVAALPTNKKNFKKRYCKMCGGMIDSETKKCTACGKQYFKLPKFNKTVLLAIISSVLLVLNVFVCIELVQTKATVRTQSTTIEEQEKKLAGETNWKHFTMTKNSFMNEYIVIINDGEKTYHKYGCKYLRRSSFLAYNVANAKALGYRACSSCN